MYVTKILSGIFGVLMAVLLFGCVGSESPQPPVETSSVDTEVPVVDPAHPSPLTDHADRPAATADVPPGQNFVPDDELGKLLDQLGGGSSEDRITASEALRQRRDEILDHVNDWLIAGKVTQRLGIMLFLTGQAQQYPELTEDAVRIGLQDQNPKVRSISIQLIRQLLPQQASTFESVLLGKMATPEEPPANRVAILRLLLVLPGDRSEIEKEVMALAVDNDQPRDVQQAALQTYCRLAPAEPAIANLLKVLSTTDDDSVLRTATVLIGKYGSKSAAAVEILAPQLESEDADLRDAVAQALARIGRPAISSMAAAVGSEKRATRQIAIYTLGVIGPSAREHVELIAATISEEDEDTNAIAKEAIIRILKN